MLKKVLPYLFGYEFKNEFKPFNFKYKLNKELHLNDFRKVIYGFQIIILVIAYGLEQDILGIYKDPLIYAITTFIVFDRFYLSFNKNLN